MNPDSVQAKSSDPVQLGPVPDAAATAAPIEHFERPSAFGRLRWWFEESPIAFTASVALALVVIGFWWILTTRPLRADMGMVSVALQPVRADSTAGNAPPAAGDAIEFQQLAAASGEKVERLDEKIDLPELPRSDAQIKPEELLGNQADSDKQISETDVALRQAGEMLRKMLEANQNRGQGNGPSNAPGTEHGKGQLNPDSTPGRQARWVITYPTLPQSEYERMLDSFRIELAYLEPDRKTMQYLGSLAGVGKKYTGDADREDRMFWYWMGQNRLRDLDDSILRKHGLEPTSEVVHLYPRELERRLADMEKDQLRRQWKQTNIDRVAQTNFKIMPGGPSGWHIEVTSMQLK